MKNPLDYITIEKIKELGLTAADLETAYQPSSGGVFHSRGGENTGKSLWIAHDYRMMIDSGKFTPYDAVGNMSFKGKYAIGYQVLKGDDLRQYLWDMTHKSLKHKIIIIDEADSEFPARMFTDREQTDFALNLWHTSKLGNYVLLSSHIGKSVDLIMHLASHYFVYPSEPCFETAKMNFILVNTLKRPYIITDWTANDIVASMLIYNRQESTKKEEEEYNRVRPSLLKKKQKGDIENEEIDEDITLEADKEFSFL